MAVDFSHYFSPPPLSARPINSSGDDDDDVRDLVARKRLKYFDNKAKAETLLPQDPPSRVFEAQEGTITSDFVNKMIEDFKNHKPWDKQCAYEIIKKTTQVLRPLPSLVNITVPHGKHITVCGDLHGQFFDLLKLFKINGLPSENNPYIFNGDFVDRGSYSVEVILTLFLFKCMSPSAMYLTRGNHESKHLNEKYGFAREVRLKLGEEFVEYFAEAFRCLPLAHVINNKIFVAHGGIPTQHGVTLSDIKKIDRFREPPSKGLMCEILWNDPRPYPGRGPSTRGTGYSFGVDVTKKFLQYNNLELVVRSHEVKDEGYESQHDGKLITIFSAPNYCGKRNNLGGFIRFVAPRMKPIFFKFSAESS